MILRRLEKGQSLPTFGIERQAKFGIAPEGFRTVNTVEGGQSHRGFETHTVKNQPDLRGPADFSVC